MTSNNRENLSKTTFLECLERLFLKSLAESLLYGMYCAEDEMIEG